ncbi:MAG TPA: hypothetical protein VGK02_10730 [Candidatus Aquicultor sp.]
MYGAGLYYGWQKTTNLAGRTTVAFMVGLSREDFSVAYPSAWSHTRSTIQIDR